LIDRLDVGISTLNKTSNDVSILQVNLKATFEKVEEKKTATETLINEMRMQQADAQVQDAAAKCEADKANAESENAYSIEKEAEKELAEAKLAMKAAAAAVDCLSKNMLSELRACETSSRC
jgi:dynein heavy chain, axonemal